MSIVNERTYSTWTEFFGNTTQDAAPLSLCDCARTNRIENRHFLPPQRCNMSLSFVSAGFTPSSAGKAVGRWDPARPLELANWTTWSGDIGAALRFVVPRLRPTHVLLNHGYQRTVPLSRDWLRTLGEVIREASSTRHVTTVWKTMSGNDSSKSAAQQSAAMLLRRSLAQGGVSSEAELAEPFFTHVLHATRLTANFSADEYWDSKAAGCTGGCHGVHLRSRGNNLIHAALLRLLWPDPLVVSGRTDSEVGAANLSLDFMSPSLILE